MTRLIKETGKHLLGTLAAPATLPPPFLLCHRSQESTEGGRISVATTSYIESPTQEACCVLALWGTWSRFYEPEAAQWGDIEHDGLWCWGDLGLFPGPVE